MAPPKRECTSPNRCMAPLKCDRTSHCRCIVPLWRPRRFVFLALFAQVSHSYWSNPGLCTWPYINIFFTLLGYHFVPAHFRERKSFPLTFLCSCELVNLVEYSGNPCICYRLILFTKLIKSLPERDNLTQWQIYERVCGSYLSDGSYLSGLKNWWYASKMNWLGWTGPITLKKQTSIVILNVVPFSDGNALRFFPRHFN